MENSTLAFIDQSEGYVSAICGSVTGVCRTAALKLRDSAPTSLAPMDAPVLAAVTPAEPERSSGHFGNAALETIITISEVGTGESAQRRHKAQSSAFSSCRINTRTSLISAANRRRSAIAALVFLPSLMCHFAKSFVPVDFPPWSRHRPFGIANWQQGCPALVLAPQRGESSWGMGHDLAITPSPPARHTDDSLPAVADGYMLHSDGRLACVAVTL